jgi:ATP-dependent Lhr-like helicase
MISGGRTLISGVKFFEDDESIRALLTSFRNADFKKILFFCNSRRLTEEIGQKLKKADVWPENFIRVHHGSLDKSQRESTEKFFKEKSTAICVATMTLEVGIDIGDIDIIALVKPPPSVSSLLQRVGRGNRRRGQTYTVGLYSSELEKTGFDEMFGRAARGEIEEKTKGPCLSVAVQQIFSYLFQEKTRGIEQNSLIEHLTEIPMTNEDAVILINHLTQKGYIIMKDTRVYPSPLLIDMGDKGIIHSNIPSEKGLSVVNAQTGVTIGEVGSFEPVGRQFILSGKKWVVVSTKGAKILVQQITAGQDSTPTFTLAQLHGRYYSLLPFDLQSKCCSKLTY